jgi:hypothetical protein
MKKPNTQMVIASGSVSYKLNQHSEQTTNSDVRVQ